MAKTNINSVKLHDWQKAVITEIDLHEKHRDMDQYQDIHEYVVNKELSISIAFPKNSGHTFLSNYVAAKYPSLLVYGKTPHYKSLIANFDLNEKTQVISHYEMYYVLQDGQPSMEHNDIKKMFEDKKVVIVDNAQSVHHIVKDFILASSRGIVLFLGR